MKTIPSRPVLSQTESNTTLWIGHLKHDAKDHLAGQTFSCPVEGMVNNIQVYSSAVTQPGEILLTLHEFDPASKTWGPSLMESRQLIEKNDTSCWIRFDLEPLSLRRDAHYGFRLQSETGIIGIGEAASHSRKPFSFGQEWNNDPAKKTDRFYSYFSLAFKLEMCA